MHLAQGCRLHAAVSPQDTVNSELASPRCSAVSAALERAKTCQLLTFDPVLDERVARRRTNRRLRARLLAVALRPTPQRMALGWLLFANGHRHVTAEALYEEALQLKTSVSLATVYNTLRQFTRAGLLKEIPIEGARTCFDTKTHPHHHFFIEGTGELVDIPDTGISTHGLLEAPEGYEIVGIDVVVKLIRPTDR